MDEPPSLKYFTYQSGAGLCPLYVPSTSPQMKLTLAGQSSRKMETFEGMYYIWKTQVVQGDESILVRA